jgi:hypothetical protein
VQERKKRRIVLASILKPVDDTRMFEKMGATLATSGQYEVSIVGYPSSHQASHPSIRLFPIRPFSRLSLSRLFAKWWVFSKVWSLKPDIFIFNTHELIVPALWLKILFGSSVVYDVRENHYRNILHSGSFPFALRWPLALVVRFKEKVLAPMIDHFILAEKSYEREFKFHRSGWTVIQNKALQTFGHSAKAGRDSLPPGPQIKSRLDAAPSIKGSQNSLSPGDGRGEAQPADGNGTHHSAHSPQKDTLNSSHPPGENRTVTLLFTGTLAASTGVFQAITLAKSLHNIDHAIKLKIIGYAAQSEVRKRIVDETKDSGFIELVGIDKLVPHEEITDAICDANAGIISYPPSHHTLNSYPTKLFEYLQARLPIIVEKRWPWVEEYEGCDPFIVVDFANPDADRIVNEIKSRFFYTTLPQDVTWESEARRLLEMVENLTG